MNEESKTKLDELFNAFSTVSEGAYVYVCDMDDDYSRWSKSAVDYFDLPNEYMEGAGAIWEEHVHPDDRENYNHSIATIFDGTSGGHDMQYRARTRNGEYVTCTCKGVVIRKSDGRPKYFAGSIKNHGLHNYTDTVTGLRSLYGFFEDLRGMFWSHDEGIILQIGTTGFSQVNDIYGYSFGNRIFQTLARFIRKKLFSFGSVYRMDGTKIAAITHGLSERQLQEIYEEIKEEVSKEFYVDGNHVSLALNAGYVVIDSFTVNDKTAYACLKSAYYESKKRRLGALVRFDDGMSDDNQKHLEILNVIRNSISEDFKGFALFYQPVVDAATEKIKGAEALIRWRDATYGLIPPDRFIPVLEQDMLFPSLGEWILRRAMTDGKEMLAKHPNFTMNVNLSYTQLEQEGFIDMVMELLAETGFPPENLCLEITERCRLIDMELLRHIVLTFRENGVKIALDDFGTGFSTLGIIRELAVDTVKIEREFVKGIETRAEDQITVEFISSLADAFSSEVCVEGVETESMKEYLKKYKVHSFQGYYYSKPVPYDEFVELPIY